MLVTRRRPRIRRVVVLLSALALLGILPNQAQAASPAGAPGARPAAHRPPVTVTLVTGDKVALGRARNGAPTVSVTSANRPGRHVGFVTARSGGDLYVIPSDARRSFNSLFEADLFNVTKLAREGFDDAHAASLPLILQHTRGGSVHMGGSLRRTRELTASTRPSCARTGAGHSRPGSDRCSASPGCGWTAGSAPPRSIPT
jgi:hypothetical protein